MFFPIFTRRFPPPLPPENSPSDLTLFHRIADTEGTLFFSDFKLFVYDTVTTVDLLVFIPQKGLYLGETISWRADALKKATVERFFPGGNVAPSTRFAEVESAIRRKLSGVLSFDSTRCERFAWMEHLSESEFDALDPSFHLLLPKSRLLFSDESASSARQKLEALAPDHAPPYSPLKVIGSLNAHRLLLPTPQTPFGAFLSTEQLAFLDREFSDTITTLYAPPGGGKTTLILRKAVDILLHEPRARVLIITPTLLAGELMREKLIELMDYAAFTVPLEAIMFYTPQLSEPLDGIPFFTEATAILCDDAHRLGDRLIETLKAHRKKRWILLATGIEPEEGGDDVITLERRYRAVPEPLHLQCSGTDPVPLLLLEIRKRLETASSADIMVILPDPAAVASCKRSIDAAFGLNSRALTRGFSLQYQNLDTLLLATPDDVCGIRVPHLFLVAAQEGDYTFELSRSSETATIITCEIPEGEEDAKNHQKR